MLFSPGGLHRLVLASAALAILGALGLVLWDYGQARERLHKHQQLRALTAAGDVCDAWGQVTQALAGPAQLPGQRADLESVLRDLGTRMVPQGDLAGADAVWEAHRRGWMSQRLCEEVLLAYGTGQQHPTLALLRLLLAPDPCAIPVDIAELLEALGSYRYSAMEEMLGRVGDLQCLPPRSKNTLAAMGLAAMAKDPTAWDHLDAVMVAAFFSRWQPAQTLQTACRLTLEGKTSRVVRVLGCDTQTQLSLLPAYASAQTHANTLVYPLQPLSGGGQCFVATASNEKGKVQEAELAELACGGLRMRSPVDIAVGIESMTFSQRDRDDGGDQKSDPVLRADLIAGLARVASPPAGGLQLVGSAGQKPVGDQWFAYSRRGEALGRTEAVSLEAMAKGMGIKIPRRPLFEMCRQSGAKYCFDVDWSQSVRALDDGPTVFLSKPLPVFLKPVAPAPDVAQVTLREALGEASEDKAAARTDFFALAGGLALVRHWPGGFRLRFSKAGRWYGQDFGVVSPEPKAAAGNAQAAPSPERARLLAIMDVDGDDVPELVVQTMALSPERGHNDVVAMLVWQGQAFHELTTLVVREY